MFEITADDVAKLDDEKLRALVARLCEAELRKRGLNPLCVTWGGNQNAADGGVDVRVELPPGTVVEGEIPRPATVFQVKRQGMQPADIVDEMRPKGLIRPSIQSLADQSGAYVIVSSQGSTADQALSNRRAAMMEAMEGVSNAGQLLVDFYDRTRMATWIRCHEALIPWVREQVGRPIAGWQSYGSWANPVESADSDYLLDDKLRIRPSRIEGSGGVSALEGIRQIRDQLREFRSVVRLVGLSGVGKTRLIQALFDDRVGEYSLNPTLATYTNTADTPDPVPTTLASNLAAAGSRAILVVDNCPPELHLRLSDICRKANSRLSVITVEYDIQEDEPEGTEVFILETSSEELIQKLLAKRFPTISQVDARTSARFSDGNARVAIALAATIERTGTLSGLNDNLLFQRLFFQGRAPDESLHLVAQACSLVYSFQGEDCSGDSDAELTRIGAVVGKTPQEVYRYVAELQRRDLVQKRGVWRAVLPHAIANRLAATAIQNISYVEIREKLLNTRSGRLLKSFSRRLGYLHDKEEARTIVKCWLGKGGILEDVANFNSAAEAMFKNIAPVAPEEVLCALERSCAKQLISCERYNGLLRSLSYDRVFFERCMAVIVESLLAIGDANHRLQKVRAFTSSFHLYLSGTLASIEQRLGVVESLLLSSDVERRILGVDVMRALLKTAHFSSFSNFDFGARPRDYGWWPRTIVELQHWFRSSLKLVESIACDDENPASPDVRLAFANEFRGLWNYAEVRGELTTLCRRIANLGFWPDGWLAVKATLNFDGEVIGGDSLTQLVTLERELRPANLLQEVRSIVLSTGPQGVDVEDFDGHSGEDIAAKILRTETLAKNLGRGVSTNEETFVALLPALVSRDGRLCSFGEGLADGTTDWVAMWDRLVAAYAATDGRLRKPQVLRGFVRGLQEKDRTAASALLDQSLETESLNSCYPYLQMSVDVDGEAIARLRRSLVLGNTPVYEYRCLAGARASNPIPPQALTEILMKISGKTAGYDVAIEIMYMRLESDKARGEPIAQELLDTGSELLRQLDFSMDQIRVDYRLGVIATFCLNGEQGAAVTTALCVNLRAAVKTYVVQAHDCENLITGLLKVQPWAALDGLCGSGPEELDRGVHILRDTANRKRPLEAVPDDELLRWCDQEAGSRYPAIAYAVTAIERVADNSPRWTTIALRFLGRAPDPSAVLHRFVLQFAPVGGLFGSLASTLESNAPLLDQLDAFPKFEKRSRAREGTTQKVDSGTKGS